MKALFQQKITNIWSLFVFSPCVCYITLQLSNIIGCRGDKLFYEYFKAAILKVRHSVIANF